jgi:putative endonuclease|tara:strand:+ start:60 stop:362 length:303 start_codon:yes stop_codon:yes gene_type:complete
MQKGGYVYITTTKLNSVFYIGVTSDLHVRDYEHKKGIYENSFTKRYHVKKLVYYERYDNIEDAIRREKQLKGWRRAKKIKLIRSMNPEFKELSLLDDVDD